MLRGLPRVNPARKPSTCLIAAALVIVLLSASPVRAEQTEPLAETAPDRWLEAADQRVRDWDQDQTHRAREVLDTVPGREALTARVMELARIGGISPPAMAENALFFVARPRDRQQAVLQVQDTRSGQIQTVFDPHDLDAAGRTAMSWFVPSQDGKLVALGLHQSGDENTTLRVVRVRDNKLLPDQIRGKAGAVFWLPNGKEFIYRRLEDINDPFSVEIRFHRLGKSPDEDPVLLRQAKTGPLSRTAGPFAILDDDARWLVIAYWTSTQFNDLWFYDFRQWLKTGVLERQDIMVGQDTFGVGTVDDHVFYLTTTLDAPNGRAIAVDLRKPGRENWLELLPERSNAALQDVQLAKDRVIASYVQKAASHVELLHRDGRLDRVLELPGQGTARFISAPDQPLAYFSYEDFMRPDRVYRVDSRDGEYRVWAQPSTLPDTQHVQTRQVSYASRDGTVVTMWLVGRGVTIDGPSESRRPVLIEAYGGFDVTMTPRFDPMLLPWLDAGGLYAVPNLRGGGEYGEDWYLAGVRENKQNTIDDLLAAAEWLIDNGYSSTKQLAVRGTSNGGLTAAAALTQRPELFAAAVLNAPLTDMLRYQHFLIAGYWAEEYGVADDPQARAYLRAYSPLHNIRAHTRYPAVLITAGEHDRRVHPLHARKFTAALQRAVDDYGAGGPVLLRLDSDAGHGRGEPTSQRVLNAVDELAFLAWQLGLTW